MKKFTMILMALTISALFASAEWRAATQSEMDRTGANRVFEVDYTDLTTTTTNTAQTLTVAVPAKAAVQFMLMELDTAFDTANTNYTGSLAVIVGDGSNDDAYLTSTELASDGTEIWKKFGPTATREKVYTVADTLDFKFTPNTEEAVSANTSGHASFYFRVVP